MKKITALILVCFSFVSFSAYCAGISRSIFSTEIIDKEPVSILKEISAEVTRVYFFTEITGLSGHTISHRWEYNGQVLAELEFKVNGDRWRTWSSKNMLSSWLGKWQVSVLDEAGNIIEQSEFNYIQVNNSKDQNGLKNPVGIAADKNPETEVKEKLKQQ